MISIDKNVQSICHVSYDSNWNVEISMLTSLNPNNPTTNIVCTTWLLLHSINPGSTLGSTLHGHLQYGWSTQPSHVVPGQLTQTCSCLPRNISVPGRSRVHLSATYRCDVHVYCSLLFYLAKLPTLVRPWFLCQQGGYTLQLVLSVGNASKQLFWLYLYES